MHRVVLSHNEPCGSMGGLRSRSEGEEGRCEEWTSKGTHGGGREREREREVERVMLGRVSNGRAVCAVRLWV
jgi:hypothetical protein